MSFPPRAFGSNRFTSKQDAISRRVHVWACKECGAQHPTTKPITCQACGHTEFWHFDSQGEAKRFAQLRLMLNAGMISNLRLQVPYPLFVNGEQISRHKLGKPITTYIADFCYRETRGGEVFDIVEDYKGDIDHGQTDLFKLKRKLIEACYSVHIRLTTT